MKRVISLVSVFCFAAVLSGCGGGSVENSSVPSETDPTGDVSGDLEAAGMTDEDYQKALQEEANKAQ